MVIVFDRDKAERLQHTIGDASHGAQHLGHAVHRTCLRLEGDFYEVTLSQRLCKSQQATSGGNGLEFGFRTAAVFQTNRCQDGIA